MYLWFNLGTENLMENSSQLEIEAVQVISTWLNNAECGASTRSNYEMDNKLFCQLIHFAPLSEEKHSVLGALRWYNSSDY